MRKSLVLAPTAGAFAMVLSRTASLLAISLTILSTQGRAQTQMVLVTTGSTMPEPLYVLWGDEYHKLHTETQLRYLPVGTSESAKTFSPEPEIWRRRCAHSRKAVESSGAPDSGIALCTRCIAVFYNLPGDLAGIRLSGPVLANIYLGKTTSWRDQRSPS